MENQDQAQVVNSPVGGGEAAATPELSINDLQNLRAIVDTAVRRGAFSAAEISAVGSVYDRVNAFLNSVAPAQKSEAPAA